MSNRFERFTSSAILEVEQAQQMEQAAIFRDHQLSFPGRKTTLGSKFDISAKLKKLPLKKGTSPNHPRAKSQVETEVKLVVGSGSESDHDLSDTQILPPMFDLQENSQMKDDDCDTFIVLYEEEQKFQEEKYYEEEIEDYTQDQFNNALDTEEESEEARTMSSTEFENALNSENELEVVAQEKESSESEEVANESKDTAQSLYRKEMEKQDAEELRRVAVPILGAQHRGDIDDEINEELRGEKKKKLTEQNSDELTQESSKLTKTRKIAPRSNSRYALTRTLLTPHIIPLEGSSSREGSQGLGSDSNLDDDDEYYIPEKEDKEKTKRLQRKVLRDSQSDSQAYSQSSQNYSSPSSQHSQKTKGVQLNTQITQKKMSLGSSGSFPQNETNSQNREAARLMAQGSNKKQKSNPKLVQNTSLVGAQAFSSQNKGLSELGNSKQKSLSTSSSSLFFRSEGSQGSKGITDQKPGKLKKNTSQSTSMNKPLKTVLGSAGVEEIKDTTPKKVNPRSQGKK